MTKGIYRIASLFSGCGGADKGFLGGFEFLGHEYEPLPFEVVWANDIDEFACIVYWANLGKHMKCGDITRINFDKLARSLNKIDVVLGGFPCQEFSLMGPRRGLKSPRGQLYRYMRKAIRCLRPKLFLAENVPGIEHPPSTLNAIVKGLKGKIQPRYNIKIYRMNTADYGIPQIRKRILIVGIRCDLPDTFKPPEITNISPGAPQEDKPKWVTARVALESLWNPSGGDNHEVKDQDKLTKATIYISPKHKRDRRLNPDLPSTTIRAEHHGHVQVHYNTLSNGSLRRLTVRECARIQGFPDTFAFPVSTTQAYKQIGNAIAPVLAHHWAASTRDWLNSLD